MKKILILIIIVMFFLISNSNAIVCCEQSNGNYCVEKDNKEECTGLDDGYKAWTGRNCAQVENCKKGCCVEGDEGSCFSDSEKVKCLKNNGKWFDKSCSSVALCAKGCCFIGTNTWFITQGQCLMKANQKGLSPVFETDAKDDNDCQEKLDEKLDIKTMGCCISEDGGCNYQEKGTCSNFVKVYCMDIKNCGCKSGFSCEGKRDVYEISSCGDERIVKKCDGVKKVCGLVRSNDNNAVFLEKGYYKWKIELGEENLPGAVGSVEGIDCVNIGCEVGKEFLHDGNLNLYENIDQIIKIDKDMLGGVDYRKNGESWCINPESKEAGTRYYKYRCGEGKIISEGCSVTRYKEGICKENRENDFTEADCVDSVPDYWTRGKAMDNPGGIISPPAFKFYDTSKSWSDGVSLKDTCGYCEASSKILERLIGEGCTSSKCNALGDCDFNTAGFSGKGCVYGALAAEAMWLTMGSIFTIGSGEGLALGEGGIADPGVFANTGWGGFWDTGLFGDVGKKIGQKAIDKELLTNTNAIDSYVKADSYLEKGQAINGLYTDSSGNVLKGIYYKNPQSVTDAAIFIEKNEANAKAIDSIIGNLGNHRLGTIISPKEIVKKTAEGILVNEAIETYSEWKNKEDQSSQGQPSVLEDSSTFVQGDESNVVDQNLEGNILSREPIYDMYVKENEKGEVLEEKLVRKGTAPPEDWKLDNPDVKGGGLTQEDIDKSNYYSSIPIYNPK